MIEQKHHQSMRIRGYKYAFLSLLLIIALLITTSCAALLTGDNRKAYDLMVKASDEFK